MSGKKEEERYFIVAADQLGSYGSEAGSTREEAEQLLADSADEAGQLVVIKGKVIKPTFVLGEK